MRLIERLTRLAKADAHGLLEHLEERALLAKQHLREAELEIDRKRARVEALDEKARRLDDEATRLEEELAALDADVELALDGGQEDLARFAVRRLLPKRRTAQGVRRRLEALRVERRRLGELVAVQEGQLEELRHRVRTQLAARAKEGGEGLAAPAAADEEVELELLRRRGARSHPGAER